MTTSPAFREDSQHDLLQQALTDFDEFIYFPSIPWNHTWERQQTLIAAFCEAHPRAPGYCVSPTGIIDHRPWSLRTLRNLQFNRLEKVNHASHQAIENPTPANLEYIQPRFPRATNGLFSFLCKTSSAELRHISKKKGRRLVLACYTNSLTTEFLSSADFSILDLAERRQANPHLSRAEKELERVWSGKTHLLVADNQATLADYAESRAARGRSAGHLITQGFSPPPSRQTDARGKLAAYLGNLHHAIDYELLDRLIADNQDWTFRFCGEVMDLRATKILAHPNVIYAGKISHAQIPEFLSTVNWGLIPYKRDDWTAGVFPTKLFEYLAHDVRVLSTSIPEVCRYRDDFWVSISDEPVRLAHTPRFTTSAKEIIASETWSARLDQYARAIMKELK